MNIILKSILHVIMLLTSYLKTHNTHENILLLSLGGRYEMVTTDPHKVIPRPIIHGMHIFKSEVFECKWDDMTTTVLFL